MKCKGYRKNKKSIPLSPILSRNYSYKKIAKLKEFEHNALSNATKSHCKTSTIVNYNKIIDK